MVPAQRGPVQRRPGEFSLLSWIFAPAKIRPSRDRTSRSSLKPGEPEHDQRVHQGQQLIDLKTQVVGQVGQVGRAVVTAQQDFGEAGQPVDGYVFVQFFFFQQLRILHRH